MLTIVNMNRAGLSDGCLTFKVAFEFDNSSTLPERTFVTGGRSYVIAKDSTAKNTTTNSYYKYNGSKWVKTSETSSTTNTNNIIDNGNYNIPNNDSTGFNDVNVDVSAEPPVLIEKSITENGEYNASEDNANGYSSVTVDVAGGKMFRLPFVSGVCTPSFNRFKATNWTTKTWNGLTTFYGSDIWTDGDNIYYSRNTDHYVLNKSTSTWTPKTWSGLATFNGRNIWTDGDNIYYSNDYSSYGVIGQYVLNKSTSTWESKTWSGLTSFSSNSIWTDGDNIYYLNSHVLEIIPVTKNVPSAKP